MNKESSQAVIWGSDVIAEAIRETGVPYLALTPGASFRGLHDSLVNHLGNERPELLLCLHEEHAVALAHGYAKVNGEPLGVALHSNVGLMHATMAVFNAYADRVPMMILGADGPADSSKRRPWIDWLHTSVDIASLVRGYVKWDDKPLSAPATVAAIRRGNEVMRTEPTAPVFINIDVAVQEEICNTRITNYEGPSAREAYPAPSSVREAAELLDQAQNPVILMGRVSRKQQDWDRRIQLAERLGAKVITHHKLGAAFPTAHQLHVGEPSLFLSPESETALREADVVLSLDWLDLGGTLEKANAAGKIVAVSLEHQLYSGWNKLDFTYVRVDVALASLPDLAVRLLLEELGPTSIPQRLESSADRWEWGDPSSRERGELLSVHDIQRVLREESLGLSITLLRVPFAWKFSDWPLLGPLDYLGGDGGGGIGAGPGMATGSALALRGSGRLPVAVLGDGDFLMGCTALWTAVRYEVPLLVIVANNSSFYNDEIHQQKVAIQRDRPVERSHIGLRIDEPDPDLAAIAKAQGCSGFGPVRTEEQLEEAVREAIQIVRNGGQAVVDVRVTRGYGNGAHNVTPR